ncbi:MAG: L-serine ammonia-lyase, iron-sulfur-dependent subunit beta [Bacteroidota bacterium]
MPEKSSIFDMIGPVMIGPSSSHTAGVVKIGKVAHRLMGETPDDVEITFYNSFARTYEGHGSDRAILAGLLGMNTDDERIKTSLALAKEAHVDYRFKSIGNASTLHPNTVKLAMKRGEDTCTVVGESRGGGVIRIRQLNGFEANFSCSLHTMVIKADDKKGSIAFITDILSHDDCNIATMTVSRKAKNDMACLILEMDSAPQQISIDYINHLNWVKRTWYIPQI